MSRTSARLWPLSREIRLTLLVSLRQERASGDDCRRLFATTRNVTMSGEFFLSRTFPPRARLTVPEACTSVATARPRSRKSRASCGNSRISDPRRPRRPPRRPRPLPSPRARRGSPATSWPPPWWDHPRAVALAVARTGHRPLDFSRSFSDDCDDSDGGGGGDGDGGGDDGDDRRSRAVAVAVAVAVAAAAVAAAAAVVAAAAVAVVAAAVADWWVASRRPRSRLSPPGRPRNALVPDTATVGCSCGWRWTWPSDPITANFPWSVTPGGRRRAPGTSCPPAPRRLASRRSSTSFPQRSASSAFTDNTLARKVPVPLLLRSCL